MKLRLRPGWNQVSVGAFSIARGDVVVVEDPAGEALLRKMPEALERVESEQESRAPRRGR